MRDHPWHGSEILAGMWGGWNRFNEKYRAMRQHMFQAVNPIGEVRYMLYPNFSCVLFCVTFNTTRTYINSTDVSHMLKSKGNESKFTIFLKTCKSHQKRF